MTRLAQFGKFIRKYLATFRPNENRLLTIQIFRLSTEFITKGKLVNVGREIHSDEGLTLETSALESLYSGQITLGYQFC